MTKRASPSDIAKFVRQVIDLDERLQLTLADSSDHAARLKLIEILHPNTHPLRPRNDLGKDVHLVLIAAEAIATRLYFLLQWVQGDHPERHLKEAEFVKEADEMGETLRILRELLGMQRVVTKG